jgi:hypothetical protein
VSVTDDESLLEPTDLELAEAEALARALEDGAAPSALPEDALATARVVQLHRKASPDGTFELSDEARQRILQRVVQGLAEHEPSGAKPKAEPEQESFWSWLKRLLGSYPGLVVAGGGAFAAAAVIGLFIVGGTEQSNVAATASVPGVGAFAWTTAAPPVPSVKLLQAQAAWIASASEHAEFERDMREYRQEVYVALREP